MLAATSLVNEKERRTLEALIVTPVSMGEVFAAKGLLGAILSLLMGIVILVLNQSFGSDSILLGGRDLSGCDNGCRVRFDTRGDDQGLHHPFRHLENGRHPVLRAWHNPAFPGASPMGRTGISDLLHHANR